MTNTNSTELLANIPPELRTPALWLMSKDKKPAETFKTAEDKAAHCRTLDRLLTRDNCVEVQRVVMKDEGLIYIDLDHVRNADTGETELWADNLIEELNTYTELSRSGTGYHLVCRGKLDEDFNLGPPSQVEIFSGNRPNKLMALTGNIMDPFHAGIEDRQELACALLKRVKRAGKVAGDVAFAAQVDWRTRFHRVDELPDGDIRFLIDDVLPEGVAFIGALSGAGKTWFCLSMARALTTGKKFLGNHSVPEKVEVLYLCPEMNAKTFKKRCKLFGINERFHCQTISDGVPLDLNNDPVLAAAVNELKPVVFLDTAIRFAHVEDENSSSQNAQGLAKAVFALIHLGAQAVVCLHHRSKAGAENDELTLENTLRGTTDFGAMCDVVWGIQYEKGTGGQYAKDSRKFVRLQVSCVKARDFVTPEDIRIQLSPHIDMIGDFGVLEGDPETTETEGSTKETEKLDAQITANPKVSMRELTRLTDIGINRLKKLAAKAGWHFSDNGWVREEGMAF